MTAMLYTRAELRDALAGRGAVALVPTMGALHDGHRELLRSARRAGRTVVVSIFVNPLQFGPAEDLDRYPLTLDSDLAMCRDEQVDLVFAPSAAEMYPGGRPAVTVHPGPAGEVLEGEFRPGFFTGVLTVVLKLFSLVRPETAVFGEKDAQQLALVRRMAADLDLGIVIEPVATVRDPDGLAISSRNRNLSPAERRSALALPHALRSGVAAARAGSGPDVVLAAARAELNTGDLSVDYVALADPDTFQPAVTGAAVLAVAARAGATRLIDNIRLELNGAAHH
jgi:pantoate--beta-alanine ligase